MTVGLAAGSYAYIERPFLEDEVAMVARGIAPGLELVERES